MRILCSLFLACLLAACSINVPQTPVDSASQARAAFGTYVEAINTGDLDAAAAMYDRTPGFHWIEFGHVRFATGDDAATSIMALAEEGATPVMTVQDVLAANMGDDAALVSAHYDFRMQGEDGARLYSHTGWLSLGFVRRADGWKIAGGQNGPGGAD